MFYLSDYPANNIIVIVIHTKANDFSRYGSSKEKIDDIPETVFDWDARESPLYKNQKTLDDLTNILGKHFASN